ncbi:unnamed protein product [Aphanomyces euteiches]
MVELVYFGLSIILLRMDTIPTAPFRNHIEWLTKQDSESSKLFWQESLKHLDKTAPLVLPKPTESHDGENKYASTATEVKLPDLSEVCKHLGTTSSTIFRAAWSLVLQQYTRSEYVKFGSVVSGRDTDVEGVDQMIGVMINTVPILVHVAPSLSISDVISSVHDYSVELVRHTHCSLTDIKSWSSAAMTDELFETILVYENYPSVEDNILNSRPFELDVTYLTEHIDVGVSLAIAPSQEDGYHIYFSYNSTLASSFMVEMMRDRFVSVLAKIANKDYLGATLLDFDVPSEYEISLINASSFGSSKRLPYELLHHAFEERAAKKPQLLAVEYEGKSITYGELNDQATTLAHELVSLGVGVGSRVAVVMERCLEFPIGLLAVLKAGGSMMPLDATFPANRLTFMLGDANASVVVTTEQYRAQVEALNLEIPVVYISSTDLAASPKTMSLPSPATRYDEAVFLCYMWAF